MEVIHQFTNRSKDVDLMISKQELKEIARDRNLPLDLVEKDYALGWILIGLYSSSLANFLIFKGGTALSKVYFPLDWRVSEDLDFTLQQNSNPEDVSKIMVKELPKSVLKESNGLKLEFKKAPYTTPNFLRVRIQYSGLITKNNVKIEVTKEKFIGDYDNIKAFQHYDYPKWSSLTYTLNNILAEKLRAIIERGHVRDYYDSWRLLKENKVELNRTKELFKVKCAAKGVAFNNLSQFFPDDIVERLEPYLSSGLTRMSPSALPPLSQIIKELKFYLTNMLG